jgi:ATP-dependent RNA helicase DeaD
MSPAVETMIRRHARDPKTVTIAKQAVAGPPLVEQVYYEVRHPAKRAALARVIDFHDARSGIVFCNTQRMVEELADFLSARGCSAERLHGGMAQAQRTRVMEGFKKGAFRFLVATDVAARGIDVIDLELVVNYDLPYDAEDYVHRIGRTGRAGRAGRAVTLVSGGGIQMLRSIERFTATRIQREPIPTAEMVSRRRADALVERLRETLATGPFPQEAGVVKRLLADGRTPEDVAAAILRHFAPAPTERDEFLEEQRPSERRPPRRQRHLPQRPDQVRRPGRGAGPRTGRASGHPAKRRKIGPGKQKRAGG